MVDTAANDNGNDLKRRYHVVGHSRIIFQQWVRSTSGTADAGPEYFIESFIISKEMRQKGLGRLLLQMIEGYIFKLDTGYRRIKLSLLARDDHVVKFYSKVGFETVANNHNGPKQGPTSAPPTVNCAPPPPPLPVVSNHHKPLLPDRKTLMSKVIERK